MADERLSVRVELGAGDEAGAEEQDELTRSPRDALLGPCVAGHAEG